MAVDIIARALAAGMMDSDGKVSPDKLPTINTSEPVKYSVGGIQAGDILKGQNIFEVIMEMLYGAVNPILEDPYLEISLDKVIGVAGESFITNGVITFNRGKIEPAYGTSGYRAGLPTSYRYNGIEIETQELSVPITLSIPILNNGDNEITFAINYSEGEQPKNSVGEPYDSPLPAGTVTKTIVVRGEIPIYTLDANGDLVLVPIEDSYYNNGDLGEWYQITMAPEKPNGETQEVAINSEVKIVGVKVFDEITKDWQWLGSEDANASMQIFKEKGTITKIIGDKEINYTIYQSDINSEYHPIGERLLRFYIRLPIDD